MTSFATSSETHDINIVYSVEKMYKGQDYICHGNGIDSETGESFRWVMLNDGHGTDACINFIRSIPDTIKSELIGKPDPIASLVNYIDKTRCVFRYESSGATAVILKCYANRGHVITCGDSQAVVFKDGEVVHITKEHNCYNESERERLTSRGVRFVSSRNIKVIKHNEIINVPADYATFREDHYLACTQALGHNSLTGYAPDNFIIPFEKGSTYKFVLGSDGLFDMTMLDNECDITVLREKNGHEIMGWCMDRWLQEWNGDFPENAKNTFQFKKEDCVDISVATINICPNV
jgi:serine/threonine protein phosphatase PrpC